ncbi:hypothetical protein [Streptomyces alkaliphilus]|uniref:hypothetical protein n=1 Tax=Streptomyces alkaliphilus TaxID=1472722 RepID=UPI002B1F29BE|nr:hypothetical protein [Streptomyces alkaliphilus]
MSTPDGTGEGLDHDLPLVRYRILLPEEWYRIPLAPEECEEAVDRLVRQRFKGVDNAPHLKANARKELLDSAADARRNGGLEMYLCLQSAGPLTIPASLLITLLPPSAIPARSMEELLAHAEATADPDTEVDVVGLPSGPALRVRRREAPPPQAPPGTPHSVAVDHHLPLPHTDGMLLLSFNTPLPALADALARLFDAVAGSLVWVGEEESS